MTSSFPVGSYQLSGVGYCPLSSWKTIISFDRNYSHLHLQGTLTCIRKMKDYQNTHCYSPIDSNRSLLLIAPRCQHLLQCAHNLCGQLTVSTPTSSRSRARTAAIFGLEVLWMIFSTMDISSSLFVPSSRFRRSIVSEIYFMHSLQRDTIEQWRDTSILNVFTE